MTKCVEVLMCLPNEVSMFRQHPSGRRVGVLEWRSSPLVCDRKDRTSHQGSLHAGIIF